MAELYSVGNATLREALRILEVQGLIRLRPGPGGGPVLNRLTPRDFAENMKLHLELVRSTYAEVLEARAMLEPVMARLAAERQEAEPLASLRDVIKLSADIDLVADAEGYQNILSRGFHLSICRFGGNQVLSLLSESLKEVFDSKIWISLWSPGDRETVRQTHKEIADAIFNADPKQAESLMREHMEDYVRRFESQLAVISERILWRF